MLRSIFKRNDGFTLVEIAVSTAAMTGLMAMFALLPMYKVRLADVDIKQRANALVQEAVSSIEDRSDHENPQFRLNGLDYNIPTAGHTTTINGVKPGKITYTATIQSYYIDATDSDGDGDRSEINNDGSHVGRIKVSVFWHGYTSGSVNEEITVTSADIFP